MLYYEEIHRAVITDGLTRAYNRRYLGEFLDREMARCGRHGHPLSLALFDVDCFERVCEDFGRLTADAVLRAVAGVIRGRVRREDCFARMAGAEFAVALPDTHLASARAFAERIRQLVSEELFDTSGDRIPVTLSAGVAALQQDHDDPEALVGAAHARLAEATRQGGDRVF
jgi:diguanylate cyclase (GGDEF)-like protein